MSHRKFEAPRHGNLGFLPRKRCRRSRGRIKTFPKDITADKPHLTAFIGYKVGTTHTVRELNRIGSGLHKKEICEQVTIVETPPMVAVGIVGYRETPVGVKAFKTVWAQKLGVELKRNYIKRWYRSKKKAFHKHVKSFESPESKKEREAALESISKLCQKVRIIAHTLPRKTPKLMRKTGHILEIQVNGGSMADKVKYAKELLEKEIAVGDIFKKDELIDTIGITKGKGFKGVVSRWGVTRLPRKTHKGLRKVACIGSWHPARVSYTVARAGQKGYHHRVSYNKKIFMVGKDPKSKEGKSQCSTPFDLTKKNINPMGGWPNYGIVRNEFLMLKGAVAGPFKRCVTLRKSLIPKKTRVAKEEIKLKFIDTSSKSGIGRFQTHAEKRQFMGPLKKDILRKREEDLKKLALARKKKKEKLEKLKAEAKRRAQQKLKEQKEGKKVEKKEEKKDDKKAKKPKGKGAKGKKGKGKGKKGKGKGAKGKGKGKGGNKKPQKKRKTK